MKKRYAFILLFTLFIASTAIAQTIRYVKPGATGTGTSWANAAGDLQGMINAAVANDEVWVAAGTYYPTEKLNTTLVDGTTATADRDKTFIMRTGVKVYGGFIGTETALAARNFTTNVTTLSGDLGIIGDRTDNAYHVIGTKNAASGAILDGFTVEDGNANGAGSINGGSLAIPQNCGGAIATRGTTTNVQYSNLIIRNNEATSTGGAVYLYTSGTAIVFPFLNVQFNNNKSGAAGGAVWIYRSSGTPIVNFTDCKFTGNQAATSGGGIYLLTGTTTTVNATNATFDSNLANGGSGGAIYLSTGNLNLLGAKLTKNKSIGSGGAVFLGSSTLTSVLDNVLFEANEATTSAGALYLSSNSANVNNTKFVSNKSGTGGTGGGAIYLFGSAAAVCAPTLLNNLFYDNQSAGTSGGGAIYGSTSSTPTIVNSTFYANKATVNNGGAIYVGSASSLFVINNSILFGNTATSSGADIYTISTAAANVTLKYSLTQGYGTGNDGNLIGVDPIFKSIDYTNANDFLRLHEDSPAINAGEATLYPNLTATTLDLAGKIRERYTLIDMGAYEYDGPAPVPPLIVEIDENTPNGNFVAQPVSSLTGTITNWSIETGNTENVFAINPLTGAITVANSTVLDFETRTSVTIKVRVLNNQGENQGLRVLVRIKNVLEDPSSPVVANLIGGVVTSYRPKLSGKAEPSSIITLFVDGKQYTTVSSDPAGNWVFNFIDELTPGMHSFSVVVSNTMGTSNPSIATSVNLKLYSGEVKPTNILTPNGDGKNDVWVIADLSKMYPKNSVIVYNKIGQIVFTQKNYQNDWGGTFNGQPLETGTYYYEVNIGAGLTPVKGTITIIKGR